MDSKPSDIDVLDAALDAVVHQRWGPPSPPDAPVAVPSTPEPRVILTADPEDGVDDRLVPGEAARHVDIGLLVDMATGAKTVDQAARASGLTQAQLQADFAVALKTIDPREIARAMGVQTAEQQLKSGAYYGVVLADLVGDLVSGRLRPEHKLDLAKLLARVGRVEPKEDKGVAAGSGFVLNIVLPGGEPKPIVVQAADALAGA